MIFEELVLHNFGIYKGRHVIDLRPETSRPVVLIGALNGSGKTTLLDGLQLVLYGKFARCSNRGNLPYEVFLERCINRYIDPKDGAAIELQFRHLTDRGWETVRLHRSWRLSGKSVREVVEVLRSGEPDPVYAEHWYEHVDEFVPSRMSNLFFFDGEKIEYFADPDNAAELLKTGMHALLGLDLVDQLSKDLGAVVRKRLAATGKSDAANRISELTQQHQKVADAVEALRMRRAAIQAEIDSLNRHAEKLATCYREEGGDLYEQREQLLHELQLAEEALGSSKQQLLELAAGDSPLLLVRQLISEAESQAQREAESSRQRLLLQELEDRDAKLLDLLKNSQLDSSALKDAEQFLGRDRARRAELSTCLAYLNVEPQELARVSGASLNVVRDHIQAAVSRHEDFEERAAAKERTLNGLPHPEKIEPIAKELADTQQQIKDQERQRDELTLELKGLERQLEAVGNSFRKVNREAQLERFADETTKRMAKHADAVQQTLEKFGSALITKHINRLEALTLESLQQLMRKRRLFSKVTIEPDSYLLRLHDSEGNFIAPERLSAGERQLLAVSIVWALTKASGRPLPAVIDTPLGRLDGKHRTHLVQDYFPCASHQVILLSTDEEIDDHYYRLLEEAIARSYTIEHDEELQSSVIKSGYRWAEAVA